MLGVPGRKVRARRIARTCLRRELTEELGVDADVGEEIVVTEHAYPDRTVRLHFRRCRLIGEPRALLGQEVRWVTRVEMKDLPFPEADRTLIGILAST